jgi:hypothetical protein
MEKQKSKHTPLPLRRHRWLKWLFPVTGLAALIWFLIRVIPKPSRATYPCQRLAFPIASGFVVWLLGLGASVIAFRKAKKHFSRARYALGAVCVIVSIAALFFALSGTFDKMLIAETPTPNDPMGTARGTNPGRVVWIHDPNAADWDGSGDGYWYDNSATNPAVSESMMSSAVQELTGETDDVNAWDALFRYYNVSNGKGDVGYQTGEKINIKLNLVTFHRGTNLDDEGYQSGSFDRCHNAPQMVMPLLRNLVYDIGVDPCDIYIGSTLDGFPNHLYDPIQDEFPGVVCIDHDGLLGRTQAVRSTTDFIYWSDPNSSFAEGLPTFYVDCEYLINFAVFKAHSSAGITACAKNHFGSFMRTPMDWWHDWDDDYFDLHRHLPDKKPGMGKYRPQVDLLGHKHIDAKGILWIIDGLYGASKESGDIIEWDMPPFNTDWPSSLFVSQDPMAIDSVAFDFMYAEWDANDPEYYARMDGAEDYLHEASLLPDPCSGVFYDPVGDSNGIPASLGTHEHWNNSTDMEYSRNLETGLGIELVALLHDLGYKQDVAEKDIAVSGTVTGDYKDTQTGNDEYESIQEVISVGKPETRYSYMEHKWTINVTGGATVTFYVEAYKTVSADGDNFVFSYSTNDSAYTDMVTVTKTGDNDTAQSYTLPSNTTGTVYIRVKDSDQTMGNIAQDTIYIDDMYIESVY